MTTSSNMTAPQTTPRIITSKSEMRSVVMSATASGKKVGVVMTMGALHEGHVSLVEQCTGQVDVTVVTIFVNPTQFLPGEDFEKYPRDLDGDLDSISGLPVDFVFAPTAQEMYGESFSTTIQPPDVGKPLEGSHRPGHYEGVCTVVFKLLQAVPASVAYFGHKDYQQYLVIKKMAADLDLDSKIEVCPTVREPDGLAMSSRNRYLSESERKQALAISAALLAAKKSVADGCDDVDAIAKGIREQLVAAGISKIDYAAVVHAETLEEIASIDESSVALVAAYVGDTRLIDNMAL